MKSLSFADIISKFRASEFRDSLAQFVVRYCQPGLSQARIREQAEDLHLPFNRISVYHKAKFWLGDSEHHRLSSDEFDVVHAQCSYTNGHNKDIVARFDTAFINNGAGQFSGVQDIYLHCHTVIIFLTTFTFTGYHIAQIHVIFSLPKEAVALFPNNHLPPKYLAYVEWFSAYTHLINPHGFYKVTKSIHNNKRLASIIPLANICCSVHLLPRFGPVANPDWTSSNVLERCDTLYVNSFSDRHAYATIV
ncbi:hypothetical protein B0H21DRAFT_693435 [Amylocystis lapponica]|nr:hypothetical protein B0H21DRAFT_693435 [Amylocystis lapponica]